MLHLVCCWYHCTSDARSHKRQVSKLYSLGHDFPYTKCYKWRSNAQASPETTETVTAVKQIALGCTLGPSSTTVQQDEGKAEKCSENDNSEGKRSRATLKQHMDLTSYIVRVGQRNRLLYLLPLPGKV